MKKEHINLITKDLFNEVKEKDVLRTEGRDVFHKNIKLTLEQRRAIISEAQQLKVFPLWIMLQEEIKHLANKKMYYDSKTEYDLLFGKAMLWTVDVLEEKIEHLSKLG